MSEKIITIPCVDGDKAFPPGHQALKNPDGLLCFGGDLSTMRLIKAYQQGVFPWFNQGDPIQWWSPSERMVLYPEKFHLSRSLKKHIRHTQYSVHVNRDFESVIQHCSLPRSYQAETWITETMKVAYIELFKQGHAFCLEVEFGGQLAGGIYGVKLANVYCGESMFSTQSNGSKYALMALCQYMIEQNIPILDCQLYNPHLESMGAELISRERFMQHLIIR